MHLMFPLRACVSMLADATLRFFFLAWLHVTDKSISHTHMYKRSIECPKSPELGELIILM